MARFIAFSVSDIYEFAIWRKNISIDFFYVIF